MLTMKDVIREGDPILRNVAEEVVLPASEEDTNTLKEMIEFVINSQDPEMAEKYSLRPNRISGSANRYFKENDCSSRNRYGRYVI